MATSFAQKFSDLLSSIFSKKEFFTTATGIDIGSTSIKLVELTLKNGKIVLNTYGSISMGPYADLPIGSITTPKEEKIAEALKELLKDTTANTNRIAVSLPTNASLFRDISIPVSLKDEEIKTVVTTEARKVIPVPVADVDIDWLDIPQDIIPNDQVVENKKNVLLVAVSHDSQKRYASYMTNAGLTPVMYELEVFSSMRSVYTHERAPIVLIDLGAAHIKVSIIHEGSMRKVISMDRGFGELTNALVNSGLSFENAIKIKHSTSINDISKEAVLMQGIYKSILKDVQEIINEYEKYSHVSVMRATLLGGGAEMKDIEMFTENILGIPTKKSHPFSRAIVPELVKDIIPSIESEFTVATGLALRLLAS